MYGIFIAVVAAVAIGFIVLARRARQGAGELQGQGAVVAGRRAEQAPPAPIDFPSYGNPGPRSQ